MQKTTCVEDLLQADKIPHCMQCGINGTVLCELAFRGK